MDVRGSLRSIHHTITYELEQYYVASIKDLYVCSLLINFCSLHFCRVYGRIRRYAVDGVNPAAAPDKLNIILFFF